MGLKLVNTGTPSCQEEMNNVPDATFGGCPSNEREEEGTDVSLSLGSLNIPLLHTYRTVKDLTAT